ncbi:MAG: 2Fe-2S iron-sulfur cluster binding domain-containing protein [Pseudomonadota bacterium]
MSGGADSFHITVADTGESFDCSSHESVLHGLARLGKRGIPVGCRGGGCGVCKVEVVSGAFDMKTMSSVHVSADDLAARRVLACRICPAGDLVVKVIGPMRKAVQRTRDWQDGIGARQAEGQLPR